MSNTQHQFKPLVIAQTIPVNWELTQGDYEKLRTENDRSHNHWHCSMENDVVHIYKGFGGIEHYRFALHKQTGGYRVREIETQDSSTFYESAKLKGWTKAEIEEHKSAFANDTILEVASLLSDLFGIKVTIL